jgi:hypothetical protein
MNLGSRLARRSARSALLFAAVIGWAMAAAGAFAEITLVLGLGLAVAGVPCIAGLKLLLELSVTEANRPAAATAAQFKAEILRIGNEAASAEARNRARVDGVIGDVERSVARLTTDRERAVAKVTAETAEVRRKHDATAHKLALLEQRLTPTRRFAATRPADTGSPRELALSESLDASFPADAGDADPN